MSSKDLPSASKTLGEPDPTAETSSGSMQSPGGMHIPVSREDDTHRVRADPQLPAEPKEFQGTAASAAAPSQPRSDFASYGSVDQGRRSLGTDSPSVQLGREDPMRGRSRGRRNPPLNSPHRPDHIAPSQPISPDARYTRGRSRPERPLRQPSVSRETRPRSPILQEQFHGYAMPQPMPGPVYGFPGQAYGGAAMHPHAYPTPGVPPVIPATQYRGPDPFGSRPPRQGRPASDPPSPTGSHSFHPTGPFPAPTYGDAYANPYPYGVPTQPYYSGPPVIPQIPLGPVPEPRYVTVDPFSFNRRRRENPTHYYAPDGDIPPVSSPASHPSAPSAGASHPSTPLTGSTSHHSHPNFPSHSDTGLPLPGSSPLFLHRRRPTWHKRLQRLLQRLLIFILDILITILQQTYLHLLLRLPLLYFSRVSRLFEDANLSLPDIRRMAVANADQWHDGSPGALLTTWLPPDAIVPPHLLNFRHSWEGFIDSLLRQWETQNYVSALLLAAIITMLQIDAAASDPIARTTAILSLISALMSVLFGSMYIIRFGTMRKMYKAAIWADEAQNTRTSVLWNEWIMLAIPAVWLAWSLILFVTCIMAYAWRTGAAEDPVNAALSNNAALGLRIGASAVLGVALVYFFLVVKTFRKYGDTMDKKWNEKVIGWAHEGRYTQIGTHSEAWEPATYGSRGRPRMHSRSGSNPVFMHSSRSRSSAPPTAGTQRGRHSSRPERSRERRRGERRERLAQEIPPIRSTPATAFERPFLAAGCEMAPFAAVKMIDLRYMASQKYPLPNFLQSRDILLADWVNLTQDLEDVWNNRNLDIEGGIRPVEIKPAAIPPDVSSLTQAAGLIDRWNDKFFHARFTEAIMCREEPILGLRGYAVYLIHISPESVGPMPSPHDHDLNSITTIRLVQEPDGRHWVKSTLIIAGPTQQGEDGAHESDVSRKQNKPSTSSSIDSLAYLSIPLPPSPPLDAQTAPSPYPTTPLPDETIILHADEQVLSF